MPIDPLRNICEDPLERKWTWLALILHEMPTLGMRCQADPPLPPAI